MIIVKFIYLKPIAEVDKFRKEHLEFLEKLATDKKFIIGGRILDSSGGIGLFNLKTKDEVKEAIKNEPYLVNGLARHEIIEFDPKVISEDFKQILNK